MDRKIKLLAVTSVAAITTAACTPQGGPNAPHNQQTSTTDISGSTTSPVTHSHSGKVHAHLLPATGIRHTHTTGSDAAPNPAPATTYRPPANTGGSSNAGMTHSHSGKVHTHRLPTATGINHTHRVGGGPAPAQPRPPVATGGSGTQQPARHDPNAHSHNGRVHSHKLPATGLQHGHNTGAATAPRRPPAASNYRPPATNTYRPPARPPAGNNNGGVAHNHNGRAHSHRLPASGMNHGHNAGAANTPRPPQNNANVNTGGSSYYDYSSNNTNSVPATNTNTNAGGNSSYYDYSSGGSSAYYNTAKPKGSGNYSSNSSSSNNSSSNNSYYDYSAPSSSGSSGSSGSSSTASTGSFAPSNYSGGSTYTVQRGDTVFQVMRNTGVYWKDIIRMNNLKAPNYQIVPGQRLKLR